MVNEIGAGCGQGPDAAAEAAPAGSLQGVTSMDAVASGHATAGSDRAEPSDRPGRREHEARMEIRAGGVLVLLVAAAGAFFAARPSAIFLDRWILDVVGPTGNAALTGVTALRYPVVVVVGACIAAAVAFPRDRFRSLACLIGPPLALATCELVAKPLVGRHLGGGLSYPSGSTVGAAALVAAATLAVPPRWRRATIVVGAAYVLWMGVAVVARQWHYPTDALAGMAYGVGVVLVADGLAWRAGTALAGRVSRRGRARSGGG